MSRPEDEQTNNNINPATTKAYIRLLINRLAAAEVGCRHSDRRLVAKGLKRTNTTTFINKFMDGPCSQDTSVYWGQELFLVECIFWVVLKLNCSNINQQMFTIQTQEEVKDKGTDEL